MSGNDDETTGGSPADGPTPDERTVFMPSPGAAPADGTPPPGWTPPPAEGAPLPGWGAAPAGASPPQQATAYPPPSPSAPSQSAWTQAPGTAWGAQQQTGFEPNRTYAPMAPRTGANGIQVGDVLNHIFEVRRFIARGGMGEVFEGVNVNSDERVAIKVMLPALAADPNVQAMFRKEAKTLTRLNHSALVQYRVLAQEPQLGVLYIVTDFVDGANLADVLSSVRPDPAQLRALARRLADGLRVAHGLGAIHRDISPDNVLLEGGRLENAKIIDFGISKDLDPGSKTIVGDGFAGKLGYVAPEQLGAFGRDVGPWSDVYSLGLVLLAVATGRNVDMGATLFEAVDKRQKGVDISGAPEEMRGVLEQMLRENPADRLRSMEEVIAALDAPAATPGKARATAAKGTAATTRTTADSGAGGSKTPMLVAGGVAAALVLGGGAWLALRGGGTPATPGAASGIVATAAAAQSGPRDQVARSAIVAALPSIGCTWLDVTDVRLVGEGVGVTLTGVADAPGRAQSAISQALAAKGIDAKDINFEEVATVPASACTALDAFRAIRAPDAGGLTVEQRKWELTTNPDSHKPEVQVVMNVDLGPPPEGVAFFGLHENGVVENVDGDHGPMVTRAEFDAFLKGNPDVKPIGQNSYRLPLYITHQGWSGFLLLKGREPFDAKLVTQAPDARGGDWKSRFEAAAKAGGWRSEMVWFKTVDEIPG